MGRSSSLAYPRLFLALVPLSVHESISISTSRMNSSSMLVGERSEVSCGGVVRQRLLAPPYAPRNAPRKSMISLVQERVVPRCLERMTTTRSLRRRGLPHARNSHVPASTSGARLGDRHLTMDDPRIDVEGECTHRGDLNPHQSGPGDALVRVISLPPDRVR